jgi:hypothetical protein
LIFLQKNQKSNLSRFALFLGAKFCAIQKKLATRLLAASFFCIMETLSDAIYLRCNTELTTIPTIFTVATRTVTVEAAVTTTVTVETTCTVATTVTVETTIAATTIETTAATAAIESTAATAFVKAAATAAFAVVAARSCFFNNNRATV